MTLTADVPLSAGTCAADGGYSIGHNNLRLFAGAQEVASYTGVGCASIDFTPVVTGTYELRIGCFAGYYCSGIVGATPAIDRS